MKQQLNGFDIMSRKVKLDFVPSEYQEKIFTWVQHGVGNAVVQAFAGCSKTTTAVAAMKFIPKDQKCLFIAFNKSIADELNERLKGRTNCTARTTHSLGFLMIRRNLGSNIEVDEYKYRNYVKQNIMELTTTQGEIKTRKQILEYIDNITKLIDFSRFYLAQSEKEINEVAIKYDIPVYFDECAVVKKCLEWGKENYETVDYTDMIWLPIELSLKPIGLTYDWVFFDEIQDASICSIQLFKKCIKRGGRFFGVGDKNQMIYNFAGSSEEAFNIIKNLPNTILFDLPISYRCAKKIVSLANTIVPDISARDNAPDGIILENCNTKDIKDGDMVLCRSKAPLMTLYNKLIRKNVNCYIKGQDIGTNLIKELESVNSENLGTSLLSDGVFVRLFDKLFNERNKLMQTRGLDYEDATLSAHIMEKYDALNAMLIMAEKCKNKQELINHIKNIFKENSNGVCLSTIHKAKGLEADNVYILCHSSMPSKLAVKDWEKLQEQNLIYVAYTRAKNKLGFISEKEIKPTGALQDPMLILNEMCYIETCVCRVLNKTPMERITNTEVLKMKLQYMTEIDENEHKDDNMFDLKETNNDDNDELLSDLEKML